MPPTDLHLALPKGRMQDNIVKLLADAGITLRQTERGYRPRLSLPGVEAKVLKPQNIVQMLAAGSRDCGFAGADWVEELGLADRVVEVLDTKLDPVRIVAAAPREVLVNNALPNRPADRPIRVASELEQITKAWIRRLGIHAAFVRTYGATEVFPPEDADCIVDVAQTGATLAANGLVVVDELLSSSTRFYASREAMADPEKRRRIDDLALLLRSVLEARGRAVIEVNVSRERLDDLIAVLPCMRYPTVSPLHNDLGFAVKVAAPRADIPRLIPIIKQAGGTDIVITPIQQVVP